MSVDLSIAKWFKSTRSGAAKDCVEVAFLRDGLVGVRDSKSPAGPARVFSPLEWESFTGGVSGGVFD